MNSPLLTIAVPTFNRPMCLSKLHREFLAPVLERFGPVVEVLVCDNSDEKDAASNAQFILPPARYVRNSTNIGFARNLLQCVNLASGKFVWCLSDNDEIDQARAIEFISCLQTCDDSNLRAVLIPYEVLTWAGRSTVRNSPPNLAQCDEIPLSKVLNECSDVPFILFSGVVTRVCGRDKKALVREIESSWVDNDFVQVPLLLSLIGLSGTVRYYHEPIIRYQVELVRRFDLAHMKGSLDCVIDWIETKGFPVSHLRRVSLKRWIVLALLERAGLVSISGVRRFQKLLKRSTLPAPLVLRTLLFIALLLPRPLFAWPYLLSLAISEWRTSGKWKLQRLIDTRALVASSSNQEIL